MHNRSSKTPVSYYGGKTSLLSYIMPLIPPHEVYTEVYFGGGSVFFAKKKVKNETINDVSDFVVNFYEQLKLNFSELKKLIDSSLISRTQHKRALSIYRNQVDADKLEKAWSFWYMSNFSFANKIGGGIKYSNDQSTCVPDVLKNKKARFTEWLVSRIEDAHIENDDAVKILQSRNVSKAFHYIDPPYHNTDMGHYKTKRFGVKWTEESLITLLQWCEQCKGRFMLSNYESEPLLHYAEKNKWFIKRIAKNNTPNAPHRKKGLTEELIVLNYSPTSLIENPLFLHE